MTQSVQELLKLFDGLSEDEQRLAASEILKRSVEFDYPELNDETLTRLAEERFLALDAEEAANGQA